MPLEGFGAEAGGGAGSSGEAVRQEQHPKRCAHVSKTAREQRRRNALQRQSQARQNRQETLRTLVMAAMQKDEEEAEAAAVEELQQQQQGHQQHQLPSSAAAAGAEADDGMVVVEEPAGMAVMTARRRGGMRRQRAVDFQRAHFFGSQFCVPEWMVDVPSDLGDWLVMARPEGKRCFLVASGGETVARLMNGEVLDRFQSALPNGGAPGPPNGITIVEGVYVDHSRTFFLCDLLVYKSLELYECEGSFRLYFLGSKFQEELEPRGAALCADAGAADLWQYRMSPCSYYSADVDGLRRAYSGFTPFVRDGLLFLHKQGFYEQGATPLALLFKDAATSRYLTAHPLSCVLAVRPSAAAGVYDLSTLDGLVVGHAAAAEVEGAWGLGASQQEEEKGQQGSVVGRLARFRYDWAGEREHELVVEGLRFEKPCSTSRALADPWSKILFNARVRLPAAQAQGPRAVMFEDLLRAVEGESEMES